MKEILVKENILLNQSFNTKEEAIRKAGELLLASGYINESYIDYMLEREQICTTYIGNNIAIPHGTDEGKASALHSGICVIQVPEGVKYEDEYAKIIIGIASNNDSHIDMLSNIAILCSDMDNVNKIVATQSKDEILNMFGGVL